MTMFFDNRLSGVLLDNLTFPLAENYGFSPLLFLHEEQGPALTHISLVSFLWDIGKQKSPRCDAAKRSVPSGTIPFADINFIEK